MIKGKHIISDYQQKLLSSISKLPDSTYFYLTGGTALCEFYIGHRYSFDLDIFTSDVKLIIPFTRAFEDFIKLKVQLTTSLKVIRRYETFVEYEATGESDSVRIQFALDSPYKFNPPEITEYGIKVNGFMDLAVDKLLAFFGRAEPRDAVDLYFLIKNIEISELLERAKEKDPGFDLYWFSVALMKVADFPDQISRWPVKMIHNVEGSDIKNKFSELAKQIMMNNRS